HAQAVDFGPPPSKPRPITDIPVLGPRYVGPGATFRPDALAPYKPPVPQSSVRAASSLDAANQIPAAPTSADKLLGGDSGYPLVDLASNELFNRDKSRLSQAANLLPPVFLARQGAQAGQELGRGQYGQGLARLGVNAAMGLAGDAIAARARPMGFGTFTGAGAERLPAPAFEQNPTLPEALSPAVNETPRPSAAAAQVRSALIAPKPVAAPRPAEPTESFMNWSGAAEDQALSPEARAYAAQRAGAARPAADAAYAARAAMPFPGEAGGPPINPEAPVEPQAEGFTFAHEPLVSPERAPEQASEVAKAPNVVTTHHDPFDLSGESDDFLERMLDSKNPENQARAAAEIKRRYATVPTAHPVAADATAVAPPGVRYASGAVRKNLSNVPDDALHDELFRMYSNNGSDAHAHAELVYPEEATGIERGYSMQSRMSSRLDNRQRTIDKIETELTRRGYSQGDITDGLYRASQRVQSPEEIGDADEERRAIEDEANPVGVAPEDPELRFSVGGLTPAAKAKGADILGSGFVSPYAAVERTHPRVAELANQVGGARGYANWLATRGVTFANDGLTPQQVGQFYNRLVVDNLEAVNPESRALAFHRAQYPAGIENEPWFKTALDNYKTYIENPIEPYAANSGVGESQTRRPSLGAYVKLLAVDPETGKPFVGPGASVPKNLSPRVLKSVSARQATGSAEQYSVIPQDIVASQGEKIVKGARNKLIDAARETGRPLDPKEGVLPGEGVIVREHSRPVETATGETVPVLTKQRYAVPKPVADAVAHVQKQLATGATTPWAQAKIPRLLTGASLEFSPAAAPYHMSSLTAKVGNVPGTGVLDELPNVLPILGKRAQGIARVVGGVDFSDPVDRAMEARLAKAGALRPSDAERKTLLSRVPLIGKASTGLHDLLFGPQGVDVRTRIWLGKRFVAEHPDATDDQLRKFVTDLAGNYVRENSGDLINAAQDLGVTAYARFAVPSIKTGITQNVGISGLGNRPGLVARQLVRGAPGTLVGIELLNRALSGHGPESNNAGHRFDIDVTRQANAVRGALGQPAGTKPVYAKISALDPGFSRAMRATGIDALGNGGAGVNAAQQVFNTDVLGLASPAARLFGTALSGYQPYIGRGGPIPAAQPVAPGQSQLMANIRGAISGTSGT